MAKLTEKQREILTLMASGEYRLRWYQGMGNFSSEHYSFEPQPEGRRWKEDMRTVTALEKRGYIADDGPGKAWFYRHCKITDAGRKALDDAARAE